VQDHQESARHLLSSKCSPLIRAKCPWLRPNCVLVGYEGKIWYPNDIAAAAKKRPSTTMTGARCAARCSLLAVRVEAAQLIERKICCLQNFSPQNGWDISP
jgi:hypothetical protein